jgi:glycosyltransferase involved in cell wall biosynthesis
MKISVIVTTYNAPVFLTAVLTMLAKQTDANFEVLVADDGSGEATAAVIKTFQSCFAYSLQHIWQPDDGFRAAQIRNKAAAAARGDYLIFIDGDCLVRKNFIAQHRKLAQRGWFVSGNRVLLTHPFTQQLLTQPQILPPLNLTRSFFWWLERKINRWVTLWQLPLGLLRYGFAKKWHGVKTCNFAVWRNDFCAVNGFDEYYVGWGYEDSDLVLRLMRLGVWHKSGRFATTVFHLWHTTHQQGTLCSNAKRLEDCIERKDFFAEQGVNQYL